MVDPGEVVKSTLKREFMEEAMNALEANEADRTNMEEKIDEFFSKHTLVISCVVKFSADEFSYSSVANYACICNLCVCCDKLVLACFNCFSSEMTLTFGKR